MYVSEIVEADTKLKSLLAVENSAGISMIPIASPFKESEAIVKIINKETHAKFLEHHGLKRMYDIIDDDTVIDKVHPDQH